MYSILALLPHMEAVIVGITLVVILVGVGAIRSGHALVHRRCMLGATAFSVVFLFLYLLDHAISGMRPFPGHGWLRPVFFTILISHVGAAIVLLPLLFQTLRHAYRQQWPEHRQWVRKTLPVWLYVSTTGLVVYLMTHHLPYP
ncbi:MAG: DUF420 domain-containing protein [Magnetococcales bacterium]|nr:DUF420 domain-containing protein [Magnetococcales bacterium]MBF0321599.1 DUF420 domain-containing protein [Magnetococcales bacterium]